MCNCPPPRGPSLTAPTLGVRCRLDQDDPHPVVRTLVTLLGGSEVHHHVAEDARSRGRYRDRSSSTTASKLLLSRMRQT